MPNNIWRTKQYGLQLAQENAAIMGDDPYCFATGPGEPVMVANGGAGY